MSNAATRHVELENTSCYVSYNEERDNLLVDRLRKHCINDWIEVVYYIEARAELPTFVNGILKYDFFRETFA